MIHPPIVAIYNNLEAFASFLARATDDEVTHKRHFRGDRAFLWLGSAKLVVSTAAIPHATYLQEQFGYADTVYAYPQQVQPSLCQSILDEPDLLAQVVGYARDGRLQLIPYATTAQFMHLVQVLEREHGLTVLTPESPTADDLWIRDYVDSKVGFRLLAAACLPDQTLLPEGYVCQTVDQAAGVAWGFLQRGHPCVVKADKGESGLGHAILQPHAYPTLAALHHELAQNSFLHGDLIIVEQYIHSSEMVSPSIELFVPPLGRGEPHITYISNQLFVTFGNFGGVLISGRLMQNNWYPPLADSSLRLGRHLQQLGYVGHFDVDAIVDDAGRLYLLEINGRRTGGTHVHEFGSFFFGPDYLHQWVLLSHNKTSSGRIHDVDTLLAQLRPILYPMGTVEQGLILSTSSALAAGEFGYIIATRTLEAGLEIQRQIPHLIANP